MHQFKLSHIDLNVPNKAILNAACYTLEANMAIWMSHKLQNFNLHSFNDAECGFRPWRFGIWYKVGGASSSYVSYEQIDGVFCPLQVHAAFHDLNITHGRSKGKILKSKANQKSPSSYHQLP
jgi:hypothetical protein